MSLWTYYHIVSFPSLGGLLEGQIIAWLWIFLPKLVNLENRESKEEPVKLDEEALKKRYKRIKPFSLKTQYDTLRASFLGPLFLRLDRISPKEFNRLADGIIPPFDNLLKS